MHSYTIFVLKEAVASMDNIADEWTTLKTNIYSSPDWLFCLKQSTWADMNRRWADDCSNVLMLIDLLENIVTTHLDNYILGDFNLHLDVSDSNTQRFNEILTCFNLKQHVNFSTHVHGHWLDLLIT